MSLCAPLKFGICDIYITQNLFIIYVNSIRYNRLCKGNICFILENFVLLLNHFLVISTANIGKVVSMLFCQRWSNQQTQLSLSTKYKSWNNIDLSTLNQRNSFNVVSTLFYQRWNNVDKHTSAQLLFSTKFQRWNNIGSSALNRRNSFNVVLPTLKIRRWMYVGSTFIFNQISSLKERWWTLTINVVSALI